MSADIFFITGGNGFVGRSFKRTLRTKSGGLALFPARETAVAELERVVVDYPRSRLSVLNLAWPDRVEYTSTRNRVEEGTERWERYVAWVGDLARAARPHADMRFFGVGSGIERYALLDDSVIREPYLSYAKRKQQIRQILARELDGAGVWLRLHYLFGPYEAPTRFVPAALNACREGLTLMLNEPARKRHWLYVDEATAGILQAMQHATPEDWDIAGKSPVSFDEICTLVERQVGMPLDRSPGGSPTADGLCPYVAASAIPPFMPAAAGSLDQLAAHLAWYDKWLLSRTRTAR